MSSNFPYLKNIRSLFDNFGRFFSYGIGLMCVFLLLSVLYVEFPALFFNINTGITGLITAFRSGNVDLILYLLTALTSPLPLGLLCILISFPFILKKNYKPLMHIFIAFLFSMIVMKFFKTIFSIPRPNFQYILSVTGYSFPSGHATASASLAMSFILFFKNRSSKKIISKQYQKLVAYFFILGGILISVSRIYFNVHTPVDVIAGLLLGASISLLTYVYFERR